MRPSGHLGNWCEIFKKYEVGPVGWHRFTCVAVRCMEPSVPPHLKIPACPREHRPSAVGLRWAASPGLGLTSWYWPELLRGASQTLCHYSGPDFVSSLPTSSLLSERRQQAKEGLKPDRTANSSFRGFWWEGGGVTWLRAGKIILWIPGWRQPAQQKNPNLCCLHILHSKVGCI